MVKDKSTLTNEVVKYTLLIYLKESKIILTSLIYITFKLVTL